MTFEPSSAAPVIFVVDDDPDVCNALKFSLELEGYSVRTFQDAPALLQAADASRPACMVIDYRLPGMNGLELFCELRKRHLDTPTILITSHPGRALRDSARRAGICIIEKPLLGDALTEQIHRTVAGSKPLG